MEINKNTLAKNSIFLSSISISEKIFNFLITILLARLLTTSEFGILNGALAFSSMFISFFELGFPMIIPKLVSKEEEKTMGIISGALTLILIIYPVVILTSLVYLNFCSYGIKDIPIMLSFFFVINQALIGVTKLFKGVYLGKEKTSYDLLSTFISRFILVLMIGALFFVNRNLTLISFVYILSSVIYLVTLSSLLSKVNLKFKFIPSRDLAIKMIKDAMPLILVAIFYNIYMSIDSLIVLNKLGSESAGLFSAAKRIYLALTFLPASINLAFYPSICKRIHSSLDELIKLISINIKVSLTISLPMAIFCMIYSKDIVFLLMGDKFNSAGTALALFSPALAIISISAIFTNLIYSYERVKVLIVISMLNVIVNIFCNYIFIGIFGFKGSALALFVTELVGLSCWIIIFIKKFKASINKDIYLIVIINFALILLFFLINHFIDSTSRIFVAFISSGVVYVILLSLFKQFNIKSIISNVRSS